jgi:hypothetical protein
MNTIGRVMLVAVLTLGSGCAKPDWIQQTLVTVDVTGVWVGSMGRGNAITEVRFELEQHGPNVKGYFLPLLTSTSAFSYFKGPIDGSVSGDVFSFRVTNGTIVGEMKVSGDEMNGSVTISGAGPLFLRRVDSSPPPRSQ